MAMDGHWEPLYLNREGLPRLLVKYVIRDAGYNVSVTDLANIWNEALSTAQIVANAENQSCSINPGDDAGQLNILLEKIRHVLRHQEGTAIRIGLHGSDDLTLALHAPLPSPLPPLNWTMTLTKATSAEMATEVISPLLLLAHQQQQQVKYLLGQLRDKDHVMSRLLDKMESTNTDLGSVFPGMSGGRNSQRSLKRGSVAKHVRGLAPFQPGSELQHGGSMPSPDALYGVLRDASGDDARALVQSSSEIWWRNMAQYQEAVSVNLGVADLDGDEETDDDLDFQTQTIPDHLQRQRPADISSPTRPSRIIHPDDDASTDEGNPTSSPPPIPRDLLRSDTITPALDSPSRRSNTQTRRVGTIGGRSSSQALPPSSPAKPIGGNDRARTRATMSPTPPPAPPPQSQPTPSRIRRLGAIGRGSSQMQPSLNRWSSQALPTLEEELQHQDKAVSEMLPPDLPPQESRAEGRQTRSGKRKASQEREPPVRETSVERANRKREELKQNLSAQAKAPAKKKRRF